MRRSNFKNYFAGAEIISSSFCILISYCNARMNHSLSSIDSWSARRFAEIEISSHIKTSGAWPLEASRNRLRPGSIGHPSKHSNHAHVSQSARTLIAPQVSPKSPYRPKSYFTNTDSAHL